MTTHRRQGPSRSGRFVWGGLALLLVAALVATVFLSRDSLREEEQQAEARAQDWTNTVLFDNLTPELVSAEIDGPDYRALLIAVQGGILSDDRVAQIRIWAPDGTLIFSTSQRDKQGEFVAKDNPHIQAALEGETVSVPTEATVAARTGLAGSSEKLFQTFVPLRLLNQLAVSAVVQIDQRYAALESAAMKVWRPLQIALGVGLLACVVLFVLSVRAKPVAEGPALDVAPVARADGELAERLRESEAAARDAEERAATAERLVAEADSRIVAAEHKAAAAEAALLEGAQRSGAEGVRRGVPGVGAVAAAGATIELESRVRQAEERGEELTGEVQRLKAALAERDAALALAADAASTGVQESEQVRDLASQHETRAAEAEQRAAEAAKRAAEAETRAVDLESHLREAEAALALAQSAAGKEKVAGEQMASDELRRAQLDLNDLQTRLAETETSLKDATAKIAEHETVAAKADQDRSASAEELAAARAAVSSRDEELRALRDEVAAKDAEVARLAVVQEEATAASAKSAAADARAAEMDARLVEMEARLAETETARSTLAAELEKQVASAAALAAGAGTLEEAGAKAADLEQRVRELEDARRTDVAELQHAQESLANTQIELTKATRRARELEDRLRELEHEQVEAPAYEAPAYEAPAYETPAYVTEAETPSITSRFADLVREHEAAPAAVSAAPEAEPTPAAEPAPEPAPDEGLSLRERLARAAAARHRPPGSGEG
jgi:hypothetical protein